MHSDFTPITITPQKSFIVLHDLHNCYNNISTSEYKCKLIILLLYDVIFCLVHNTSMNIFTEIVLKILLTSLGIIFSNGMSGSKR